MLLPFQRRCGRRLLKPTNVVVGKGLSEHGQRGISQAIQIAGITTVQISGSRQTRHGGILALHLSSHGFNRPIDVNTSGGSEECGIVEQARGAFHGVRSHVGATTGRADS